MNKYFYRFRPISRFFSELANQEIYLAAVPELNDPMEGAFDVYWKGDEVLWENLIRHYTSCFHYTYTLYTLLKEDKEITWDLIPINDPSGSLRDLIGSDRQGAVVNSVLSDPLIRQYIDKLVTRQTSVRANELTLHIDNVHPLICQIVANHFKAPLKNSILIAEHTRLMEELREELREKLNIFEVIRDIELKSNVSANEVEHNCADVLVLLNNKELTEASEKSSFGSNRNLQLILQDFPAGYTREVQKLLYPNFYTACFMETCSSAAIWGSYGYNHTGICLKYKAQAQVNEGKTQYYLPLKGKRIGADRNGPIFGHANEQLYPVKYLPQIKHISVDFFSNLGLLPPPLLNRDWYTLNGQSTKTFKLGDWGSERRDSYWDAFMVIATSKLEVWKHEEEHRLLYKTMQFGDIPKEQRLFKYRFEDLDGVIFGIRTSREDKIKAIKAVSTLCKELGRSDFKFYQAIYSTASHSIEYRHLTTL